jgi:hypothetical protein
MSGMKFPSLLAALMFSAAMTAFAAEQDPRVFEMRTYYAAPGKLDALHARFRDHTTKLLSKHGIKDLGYWVPMENTANQLMFVLVYPSRDARETSWKSFTSDPDWIKAKDASEAQGKLVDKVEQRFLSALDFSPPIEPSVGKSPRVFELRTYTTTPQNLPLLHARFRDHTLGLFAKHGMTNLFYWQLLPDQPGAENTLIYLLAHASEDAAKASFGAFRADPTWVAAKSASEAKGGGSLTVPQPDGVKSLFLKATDYSPTR